MKARGIKNHKGSKNPNAILSETEILIIRQLYEEGSFSQTELGATFGIGQSAISRIVHRQNWKDA